MKPNIVSARISEHRADVLHRRIFNVMVAHVGEVVHGSMQKPFKKDCIQKEEKLEKLHLS